MMSSATSPGATPDADTRHEGALRLARATIARALLAHEHHARLGEITLRASQREALARVTRLLDTSAGCLLADDVGRGKTYVALAAARRWTRPLVVVPAGLLDQWHRAMQRAGSIHRVITHESLSRNGDPGFTPDGIIVDESHRFRNPGTRGYARLAAITARAELLLLSATPVQNRAADLGSQLALFLGSGTSALDDEARGHFVVRVDTGDAEAGLPTVNPPRWVSVNADDTRVLDAIMALPAPPRALDAGDAGALRTLSLVRAWASSHAALRAAVARRLGTAHAIADSLAACRLPTRAELCSWRGGDDVVQLGFASMLVVHDIAGDIEMRQALQGDVDAELSALANLLRLLARSTSVDEARARTLVAILEAHPYARVLAFTQLATTARGYYALLRQRPGVALLTAGGGVIASGRISRREILARFAPVAQGCREPSPREHISLLISTDLLSEGVNLQDASVVVHLDLPWNPARLAQRLGRVRRPDGAPAVTSLLIAPPASTEHLVRIEERLRHKLATAARAVGATSGALPALTMSGLSSPAPASAGHAMRRARIEARLRAWSEQGSAGHLPATATTTAAVLASSPGWLALLGDGRMLACRGSRDGADAELLDWATGLAEGEAAIVDPTRSARGHEALSAYLARERLLADCGATVPVPDTVRAARRRIAATLAAVPRHLRAQCLAITARIERVLARPIPLGAERALSSLAAHGAGGAPLPWFDALLQCLPDQCDRPASHPAPDRVEVLILFQPSTGASASAAASGRR